MSLDQKNKKNDFYDTIKLTKEEIEGPLKEYDEAHAKYIKGKHIFIQDPRNAFMKLVKDGNESSNEVYYNLIF